MRNLFKSKIFLVNLAVILAVALVLGTSLPASADGAGTSTEYIIVKGKVADIASDGKSLIILQNDVSVTVNLGESTKYYKMNGTPAAVDEIKEKLQDRMQKQSDKWNQIQDRQGERGWENRNQNNNPNAEQNIEDIPNIEETLVANIEAPQGWVNKIKSWFNRNPKFGHNAKFEDIEVGDGIVIRAEVASKLARQVLIIKTNNVQKTPDAQKPEAQEVSGTVTVVGPKTFTISTGTSQGSMEFQIDENTQVILKGSLNLAGQYVTVNYKVDGNNKIAKTVNTITPPATTTANST
jgi:hypothetical protein